MFGPASVPRDRRSSYKYVSGDWPISTHADQRLHAAPSYSTNGPSVAWRLWCDLNSHMKIYFAVAGRFVRFWASERAKFPKMGDSLPETPMKHRAQFDAASFILAGEIRNRTNKQKPNSERYIHTLPIGLIVWIMLVKALLLVLCPNCWNWEKIILVLFWRLSFGSSGHCNLDWLCSYSTV